MTCSQYRPPQIQLLFSFPYKFPMEIIEYIIVHELTHLKVMNHSGKFWNEMEKVMPEYRECRTWLEKHAKEYEIF